jgi:S-adenosylmethionine synthetase
MSQGSTSRKNKEIARAAGIIARHGGEQVSGKDLTRLSGRSSADLADFRRMIAKLGIRPNSTNDEV